VENRLGVVGNNFFSHFLVQSRDQIHSTPTTKQFKILSFDSLEVILVGSGAMGTLSKTLYTVIQNDSLVEVNISGEN
jgi:hypothetical protein